MAPRFAAASALEGAWGRHASPPEVLDYWHKVVDRNRSTLADPDNPDLVFAGQTFALPPPPAAPED